MKYDLWRFAAVITLSLLIGYISGFVSTSLVVGLLVFIAWQYHQFRQILLWLRKRHHSGGPEQSGVIDEICREINFSKNRHRQREARLGSFLKRFQKATSALPDAVVILGLNGEIDWANNRAQQYLGIKWPRDAGLRVSNLIRRPELNAVLYDSKQRKKSGLKRLQAGLQIESPLNKEVVLEVRLNPYGEKQLLLVARDITSISRANQTRKDFIANASHELRTPLTVISGYLESFVDDALCPEAWLNYIRQMRTQTARMQNLIEDLLTLSTLEASDENNEKDVVRVPDMLAGIYNEAKTLSGPLQHKIEIHAEPNLYVYGNHAQLYSAFSNIVFNAIQYTPEHGEVKISWAASKDGAHMVVSDNGLGIQQEHIPRLTERFYRIDKGRSREKGGTGLGLAIVKHVLAKHGGELKIESEPGKGSIFSCNLPKSRIVPLDALKLRA